MDAKPAATTVLHIVLNGVSGKQNLPESPHHNLSPFFHISQFQRIIDMSEKIAKKIKGRFLICIWLTILFVALKVTGVIAWSWLWVLSPFLINECLSILMFLIGITLIKIASVPPDGK